MPPLLESAANPPRRRQEVTVANRVILAQRLVALFLLGCLLFGYPLLALFNRGGTVFGIPLLYAYLFGAWGLLIVLMILAVERGG